MEQTLEVVPEHEHPLKLIDLQVEYEEEEEEEEEEGGDDRITKKESFHGVICERCGEEIMKYHRYYYTCIVDPSCNFSLHKFCGELPKRLDHPLHPHTLQLLQVSNSISQGIYCYICVTTQYTSIPLPRGIMCYMCPAGQRCFNFTIHVKCAVEVGKNVIHHPSHPHLLMRAILEPITCTCSACGERHEGVFYQCTTCTSFAIHNDCAFMPKSLLIQQITNNAYYHTHPLTLSYSFSREEQMAKHWPTCRLCRSYFRFYDRWIYKCDKCMYYTHLNCATHLEWGPDAGFLGSRGSFVKFKDLDSPRLLRLPFPDETYSIPKRLFFLQESGDDDYKAAPHGTYSVPKRLFYVQESGDDDHKAVNHLTHMSHQHRLVLVDHTQTSSSSSTTIINSWLLSKSHNPLKKIQLLCNGCLRPIMSTMPFYICVEESCTNFALHKWCTRLPPIIEDHPGHPQHTLHLFYSNDLPFFIGVFHCHVCLLPCNGFAYGCVECGYYADVTCGLMPKHITHECHPNHLLTLVEKRPTRFTCPMCRQNLGCNEGPLAFICSACSFSIHPECALLIPKMIKHKYVDKKHPMHLSYHPIENHKSDQYFCEICEEDLNPHQPFYHCKDCALYVHTPCAPLILQCETQTCERYPWKSTYYFLNIKFGGIYNTDAHPHSLSFAQGTVLDDDCCECGAWFGCKMIFKCLECKFAIDFDCCKRLNKIL